MPRRSSPARTARALSPLRQDVPEPARIAIASRAQNGRIDSARGVGGHDLARLHALDIDKLHPVAGMDRDGDRASPGTV